MRRASLLSSSVLAVSFLTGMSFGRAVAAPADAAAAPQAFVGAPATPPAANTAIAAARDASGTVSEVIVTARKRAERLLDVPLSIQAFSHAEIKASGIEDIRDLADRAGFTVLPQVSTGAGGRAQGNIIFRGLQGVSYTLPGGQQSSGALFIDGIFISGAVQSVNTADIEQIEVLKGPQNAYFGRSTFGGAISMVTRRPSDQFGGEINARTTARGDFDGDASVEGPILPGVLDARVTVYDHNQSTQFHASDGGDLGAEQTRGLVGTLYFTPMPKLWFRVRGTYQLDEDSAADQAYIPARLYGGTSCTGRTFTGQNAAGQSVNYQLTQAYFCGGLPSEESLGGGIINANTAVPTNLTTPFTATEHGLLVRFLNSTPKLTHSGLAREVVRGAFQGGYKFDGGESLEFNVGYNNSKATEAFDIDHSSNNFFYNVFANIDEDLTADVRFASNQSLRLRYLVGGSYFFSRNVSDRLDDNLGLQFLYGTRYPGGESNFVDARNETPSAYGSIDLDIFSFLTATAEGRYESEQDTSVSHAGIHYKQTFDSFLPRVILKYHPTHNLNIYASYSEGAQPTTLNTSFIIASSAQQAYINMVSPGQSVFAPQPTLRNYEVGIRQELFNNSASYSFTAYEMYWGHEQTNAFIFNPPGCTLGLTAACPLSVNGSSLLLPNNARIRGIEFDGQLRATSNIDLSMSVDYKDPIWLNYYNSSYGPLTGGVTHFSGNTLGRVPNLQAVFTGAYHRPLIGRWSMYARGDAVYTGRAWDSDLNVFQTNDYVRVNARVGVERDDLTLELFATNLFNDRHWDASIAKVADTSIVSPLTFPYQGSLVQPAPLQEFGVRLQYKFQ